MRVRQFEAGDAEGVKDLILSILTREYPFDKSVYENSDISNIAKVYGGKRDVFFVVESDGDIMGTIGVKEDSKDSALLRRLFVRPSCRRKGYGSLLLTKALSHCKRKHFTNVTFRATGRMAQAINLLRKNGFEEVEKIDLDGFQIYKFKLDI